MSLTSKGKNPDQARDEAKRAGRDDARSGHPQVSSADETPTDYFETAAQASANTADLANKSEHFGNTRPELDDAIEKAIPVVEANTTDVLDDLHKVGAADHNARRHERLGHADRRKTWSVRTRMTTVGLMATGTGAALSGALLSISSDSPFYVWAFCLAVTAAMVLVGVFLAHTTRNFEYQHRKPGDFTTGRVPVVVLAISALFALGLVFAISSIRGTAGEADAIRESRAEDSAVTVDLPGEDTTAGSEDTTEPLPSVAPWTFGLLEGLLFMAAFGIEYLNYLPWSEERDRDEEHLETAETNWSASKTTLANNLGVLTSAISTRSDIDAAVLLAGEATRAHVPAETADYRRALLANHQGLPGDPWPALGDVIRPSAASQPVPAPLSGTGSDASTDGTAPTNESDGQVVQLVAAATMDDTVTERWGQDLRPLGVVPVDKLTGDVDLDMRAQRAIARAIKALELVPDRARYKKISWDPAELLDTALGESDRPLDDEPLLPTTGHDALAGSLEPPSVIDLRSQEDRTEADGEDQEVVL